MKRGTIVLGALLLLLAAPVALRVVEHLRTPPFEPGVELQYRSRMQMDGVLFARPVPGGAIEVRATRAAAGRYSLGHLSLGPSAFLALEHVDVRLVDGERQRWRVRGRRGEMTRDRILVTGRARLVRHGARRLCESIRVDLESGKLSLE